MYLMDLWQITIIFDQAWIIDFYYNGIIVNSPFNYLINIKLLIIWMNDLRLLLQADKDRKIINL